MHIDARRARSAASGARPRLRLRHGQCPKAVIPLWSATASTSSRWRSLPGWAGTGSPRTWTSRP